ncbi:MAG: redoxin domain-containing protein [Leptolinea sp.]|nr:redoxin domain-containing protein [Leptolinea sp.]
MKPIDVSNHKKDISTGEPAPDFELMDTYGNLVRLSDFQGKKYVVLALNRGFM